MPQGLQVVNFFVQGITGGSFEPLAPGTGDSATFFNVPQNTPAFLSEIWSVDDASACELSLRASRFHDQTFGIRTQVARNLPDGTLAAASLVSPSGLDQPIFPSDVLTVEVNGTAGDNVNVTFMLYYRDIPGIDANLATYAQVTAMNKNLVGINVPLTAGTGDWGATAALNSADNRLHANAWYAVLGFTADVPCAAIGMSGIDTGNLRVGGPVVGDPKHDAYLFVDMARTYGAALIPVINSNNAGNINLQAADPVATTVNVDVQLVELDFPGNQAWV